MSEPTKEQKRWLDIIKNESHKIGHLAGFKKLTPLHHEWIKKMLMNKGTYVLKAHRGAFKSSCIVIFIALKMVLCPNETMIFVRKTDDDVKEIVEKVKTILQTPVFQELVRVLYNKKLEFKKATAFEVDTNLRTEMGGAGQLLAIGLKGSLTGKHADGIIVDDICNTKDRESRSERELTKRVWYELNSNIKNPTGWVLSTGTTWHPDDVFSVMPPAEIYTCYDTGLLTDEQIQVIKDNMPPALFAANYELRFVASDDCMFTTPNMVDEKDYYDEENKVTYLDLLKNGICFLDAGYGGGDYTAFFTMNKIKNTSDYIAYGRCWRKHVNDCIPEIENLIKKYHLGTLRLENNGDKGYLAREFKYRGIRVATYHERMNKYTKISTYLYRLWKNIKWTKQTDEIFIGQILDYTETAEHDDCADIAANGCRFYIGGGKVVAMSGINI